MNLAINYEIAVLVTVSAIVLIIVLIRVLL